MDSHGQIQEATDSYRQTQTDTDRHRLNTDIISTSVEHFFEEFNEMGT